MKIFLETDRLILREIVMEDADAFFEMDSDPEVHKYLGNNPVKSKDQIIESINFIRTQYLENGIGRWAAVEKTSNEFIGWSGLKFVKDIVNNHTNYIDLGYRLRKKFWQQGYATESAVASLHYGFEKMNLHEMFASAHVDNIGSNKIIKSLGFQFVETYYYHDSLCNWYKITRTEWQQKYEKYFPNQYNH